jgi:hypothetical protein
MLYYAILVRQILLEVAVAHTHTHMLCSLAINNIQESCNAQGQSSACNAQPSYLVLSKTVQKIMAHLIHSRIFNLMPSKHKDKSIDSY